MTEFPINYPVRGLNENWAFSTTPPEFSQDETNMRARDPKTGRLRGAQRAGYSRYLATQIQASFKIKRLASVVYDKPNITFANKSTGLDSTDTEETVDTPSGGTCYRAVTDRLGNIYALDGKAGFVKYNSKFNEVYRWSFPTEDENHVVRALHVDPLLCVYAAVSEGGDQATARLWKYAPDFDNELRLAWTVDLDGYAWEIKERNGVLYVPVEQPDRGRTLLRSFTALSTSPREVFSTQIPFPCSDLDVGPDGSIFTTHPQVEEDNAGQKDRLNPQAPDADPTFVSWTPRDLDRWQERVWSWHDATNIDGQGNATAIEDGDILAWFDQSGHGRNYFTQFGALADTKSGTSTPLVPPRYAAQAQAGLPGVRFEGASLMASLGNTSAEFNSRDSQKTTVPAYRLARTEAGVDIADTGSAFVIFLVVKVDLDQDNPTARYLWSHEGADDGTDRHILVNKNSSDLTADVVAGTDTGRIMVFEATDSTGGTGGHGTNGQPASGNAVTLDYGLDDKGIPTYGDALDNTSGLAIIAYCCDGNFDQTNYDATSTHSFLWLNGRPIDRWTSQANFGTMPVFLGGTGVPDTDTPAAPTAGELNRFFRGHVLESLVIDRGAIDLSAATTEDVLLSHDKFGNQSGVGAGDAAWAAQADNEFTKIHSYLASKWGKREVLPDGGTNYEHPFQGVDYGGTQALSPGASSTVASLITSDPFIAKWSGDSGLPIWVQVTSSTDGYALRVDSEGGVVIHGQAITGTGYVRKFTDAGDSSSLAWANTLGFNTALEVFDDKHPKIAIDENDNVYVAVAADGVLGAGPDGDLVVINSAGTTISDWDRDTDQWLAYSVALPPSFPAYPDSLSAQRAEFAYVTGNDADVNSDDQNNIAKVALVTKTVNTDPPRERRNLAISNNDIIRFDSVSSATPTGGSNALDASSRWVDLAVAYEKVWITDGLSYKYYDAVGDEVFDWEASGAGEIPPRCRLIAQWNGRIVIARGDDPFDWFMSAKGDPEDWDFAPPVPLVTQAIRGSDSRLGISPDVITALIPYDDNILFIGCDSSIHRIVGEPLVTDQFDLVTDKVGIAWNSSWTKDREGRIYFFESQGGVWVMSGDGSERRRLTRDTIEDRLRDIDLEDFYVHLEWSFEFEGLHVYVFPFGSGGTAVERYYWEQQTDSWHPDTVTATDKQPTAALTIDGDDPGDRVLLVGTEDGYVLKEDPDAADDDAQAIDAFVRIGPLAGGHSGRETRFRRLQVVLADDQDGCRYELRGSNEPDVLGPPREEADLEPGTNPAANTAVSAAYVWLDLRNGVAGERFALESAMMHAYPSRRKQPRARERTF